MYSLYRKDTVFSSTFPKPLLVIVEMAGAVWVQL